MVSDVEAAPEIEAKAKIFISYSRKDMAFADRLETALKARGFEPLIDRTEIYAFEDWWQRIEGLIGKADTVIFALSPDAVASDVCAKEIAHAALLNKRFAPIVAGASPMLWCPRLCGASISFFSTIRRNSRRVSTSLPKRYGPISVGSGSTQSLAKPRGIGQPLAVRAGSCCARRRWRRRSVDRLPSGQRAGADRADASLYRREPPRSDPAAQRAHGKPGGRARGRAGAGRACLLAARHCGRRAAGRRPAATGSRTGTQARRGHA